MRTQGHKIKFKTQKKNKKKAQFKGIKLRVRTLETKGKYTKLNSHDETENTHTCNRIMKGPYRNEGANWCVIQLSDMLTERVGSSQAMLRSK